MMLAVQQSMMLAVQPLKMWQQQESLMKSEVQQTW
jgi:hypothetical protein